MDDQDLGATESKEESSSHHVRRKQRRKKAHRRIGRRPKRHLQQHVRSSEEPLDVSEGEKPEDVLDKLSGAAVEEHATDTDFGVTDVSNPSDIFSESSDTVLDVETLSGFSDISLDLESPDSRSSSCPSTSHFSSSSIDPRTEGNDTIYSMEPQLPGEAILTSPIFGEPSKRRKRKLTLRAQKKKISVPESETVVESKKEIDESILPVPVDPHVSSVDETQECESAVDVDIHHVHVAGNSPDEMQLEATQTSIDEETISNLVSKLKERVPEKCIVQKDGLSVKIVIFNSSHNSSVERSIFWENNVARLYIHNLLVPRTHPIFKKVGSPQNISIDCISDYLFCLFEMFSKYIVCKGIRSYEALWRSSKGHLDTILFEETPCFRALECNLLVSEFGKRCSNCNNQLRNFQRQMLRKEETPAKDSSRIPDKYLEADELRKKYMTLKTSRKQDKRAIKRLKQRLKSREGFVKLDSEFQKDFLTVLQRNEHKMSDSQKQFWQSQMDALKMDNQKSVRWPPIMIRIALKLQEVTTNTGYETFRQFISLPSSRRLYDYSHVLEAKEGCQPEVLRDIRDKIRKTGPEEHLRYVNLMCDEIHIRSGLVLRRSTGELVGYENLTEVETELKKLNDSLASVKYQPNLAKKALVFLAKGITSDVHDVVAVFSVQDLSACQLYQRTWDVIYNLEEADVKVLALTFDGAATNRKFMEMHQPFEDTSSTYAAINLASGEEKRPLFFILDPPHLIKTTRNCLANSFAHKKTRNLWKNGQFLSWKTIEDLFELTSNMKFRDHKLRKEHIKLTAFSCMKVSFAVQVLSESVARCLQCYQSHEYFKDHQMDELIKFIKLMNKSLTVSMQKKMKHQTLKTTYYH